MSRQSRQQFHPADEVPVGEVARPHALARLSAELGAQRGLREQLVDRAREGAQVGGVVDEHA
jgi:hypothetical protein